MKPYANAITSFAVFAAFALIIATPARAVDGVWAPTDGNSWTNAANWYDNVVPGGVGSVITNPISSTSTTLDASFTVGKFIIDTSAGCYITPGDGGSITFDNGSEAPEFQLYPGANRLWFYAPLHGANGLVVCTKSTWKPFLQVYSPGTISGDLVLSNSVICNFMDKDAFGTAKTILASGSELRINTDIIFANEIVLAGGMLSATDYYGNGRPVYITGGITLANGGRIDAGTSDGTPQLYINCPITGTNPSNYIDFRGGAPGHNLAAPKHTHLNAPVSIDGSARAWNSDTVTVHMDVFLHVNAPFSWEAGRFNFWAGQIICGAPYVFNTTNSIWFNTNNETFNHIFNLNGHNQRLGGFYGGADKFDQPATYSRITSATPATLTLDVPGNSNCNMAYRSYIDGALTVVKAGTGTQQFSCTFATNRIDKWVVEEGALILNGGVYTANAEINGGSLSGNGTLLFRFTENSYDAIIAESGTLDISNMPVVFEGEVSDHEEYVILDASAPGVAFTPAASADAPFLSVENLPEDCRLKYNPERTKVWVVKPLPATLLIVR